MAKRCNEKRVTAQAVEWGKRGACLNDIAPGIIVTPLALDEFNGPRGDFYKNMFAKCPAGRPGTADEVANVAELLLRPAAPRKSMIFPSLSKKAAEPHNSENSAGNVERFSQHQEKADGHQQRHGHQDACLGLRGHALFLHE